jgi:hypothetical protein
VTCWPRGAIINIREVNFINKRGVSHLKNAKGSAIVPVVCGVQRRHLSVGPLRWKLPVTAQACSRARGASRFCAICPQIIGNEVKGDGDCLTTNIWRPQCHKYSVRWKNKRPDKPHHQHPVTIANHPGGFRVAGAKVLIAAEGNFAPGSSHVADRCNVGLHRGGRGWQAGRAREWPRNRPRTPTSESNPERGAGRAIWNKQAPRLPGREAVGLKMALRRIRYALKPQVG